MAVPQYKRNLSNKSYLYHFKILRKEIMSDILLMDFRTQEQFKSLVPDWQKTYYRQQILNTLTQISININRAESFYPQTEEEKKNKLSFQKKSIEWCFVLYDLIEECADIFFVKNKNVYAMIANDIKKEISYLKSWKKYFNKIKI